MERIGKESRLSENKVVQRKSAGALKVSPPYGLSFIDANPLQLMRRQGSNSPPPPTPVITTLEQLEAALVGKNIGEANRLLDAHPELTAQREQAHQREIQVAQQREREIQDRESTELRDRITRAYGNDRGFHNETRQGDNAYDKWIWLEIGGIATRIHVRHNGEGRIAFASAGKHDHGRYQITQSGLIDQIRGQLRRRLVDQRDDRRDRGRGRSRSRDRRDDRRRERSRSRSRHRDDRDYKKDRSRHRSRSR